MITSTVSLASILLCIIAVSSSTPTSHHGAVPSHHKYYDSPINVQAADPNKNGEIACISPDTNIYEIYHKAEKEAKGVDMKCHFYLHNKEKSEYIGTLDINKALFDKLLTKYKHWLLTKLDSSNNVVQNQRDKVENRLIGVVGDGDMSNNVVKDKRVKVDNRLSDNEAVGGKNNGHHNTHHHKPHHGKDSHHIKDIDGKRTKNKHYIELDPKYNETHKYFEVFLPKNKHKDDPRTIYINVDEENKEFSLFDNEKHREMNYKPIKIGLRELSAIADVIFSKAEAGKTVFTVNDENSDDSEKYEIKNVDYESVDEEEDDNSFDLDSEANDTDISEHDIDAIENNYTELNETDVDEHENIEYDNTTDYLDLNNTETNVYDDAILTETANNDTEPYIDENTVKNNITEQLSDINEDLDNETLTQLEDNQNIDKATITDDNNNISQVEVHEISSEDAEQQVNIPKEENRRSEQEANGLRAQEYYAAVPDCNARFDNICNNRQVPINPTKMSNVKPHIDISHALPNALDVCKNVPSNPNFDSCMRPIGVSLPSSNSNSCNNVNFDSSMRPNAVSIVNSNSKPCNAIDSSPEELLLPNNDPQFIPQQNLCAQPNQPCLTTLSNTNYMPIQSDRNIKNVPSNVLNYNPKFPSAVLNQQYQMPLKNNANFIDNSAKVCNSLANLNKYRNYSPPFQNPFQQSSSCVSPKDLLTKLNKNTPSNSVSYPCNTRQISPLNYPSTKPNFPPNSLWYPQNRPCLPFSYKDQNPSPNICSNLSLHNICISNKILEPAKKYSPYNIHLSPNDDMTIDPTKFGYITAMPFTKPINPTKSWVPAFKSSASTNKALDSSEYNRLDTTLTSSHPSFEDESRNFVHESSISNTKLDSSLTGPPLNLNSATLLSNSNNLNNANALSNETLEALIKLLTQSGYLVTGTGSKASESATVLTENKLTSPANLDSTLIGSGLNFNQPPVDLTSGAGSSNVVSLPLDSTLLGENKLISPTNLDSTLIGSGLNFNQPPVELSGAESSNVVSLPLDSTLLGPGLGNLKRPLDSTLIGPYLDLNKSPSNIISGAVNPNVLPTTINEINTLANLDLHRLNALDSSLVGPGLSLDKTAKVASSDSIPISPNSGLNVLSSSYATSIASPSDLNRNTESIALPTLDSTLLGSKLQLPKLTLDSSLIGPSLETLSSTPMFENRSPNMIVDDNNDTAKDNVLELLKDTLETKLGEELVEKPVDKDVFNTINVDIPNSVQTKVNSPVIHTDNYLNSNIKETALESNVDSVDKFPVGDELNTVHVDLTNNTESQIESPINIINTDEGKLTNNNLKDANNRVVDKAIDILQTELDLNTTVEGVESHANFDIVEPLNEMSNSEGTVVDSGLNEEFKTLNNVEDVTGISNLEVNIEEPVLDSNSLEVNTKLEPEEHPIDVSNTSKYEKNPKDTVVVSTTNIKDGDFLPQTDENVVFNNNLESPVKEINVTEKLLSATAPNEVININSDTEATNPIKGEDLVQINNSEVIYNGLDDTKKVLTQESRIAIPNDVATALDNSLIGPSLDLLKETPLNLIGGKVDSSLVGPSIYPKMISTVHIPDVSGDNILDASLIGASLFKGNTIEMKPRLNSNTYLDSSLLGPSLNLDENIYLANDREGDRVNLLIDGGKANNLVEDRFADHSLVGHTLPVKEYTPTVVDNPLDYFDDANKLQNALLSILNSANTFDGSLTTSNALSVFKNAENSLNLQESPEFFSSRFPPIDSFYNTNTGFDSSFKNAPSPTGIGSPFVCTASSTPPLLSSTPMVPSLSPPSIPYCNVLFPSYPSPLYLNFLPHTRNEYPPLYLPPPKPFKTSILSNQNIPNSSLPPSMYSYPVLTGNAFPSTSESKSFASVPIIPNSRPVSISTTAQNIPNSFLPKSLPSSLYSNPILTGTAIPSTSESKSFVSIPTISNSRPVSMSTTPPSSSSLVKPYQTLTLPSQSLLKDNSLAVSKPYSNSLLPSNFVAPKLPEICINSLPTKSSSAYLSNPFIVNSNSLSSVPNICPILSNSISSLAPSSAISSPVSPLNLQTLTSNKLLNNSPSLLQDKPLPLPPQSLSFLPPSSIQSIKLPNSPNTPCLLKTTTDYKKPLYTSIINSLPIADRIKLPKELNTQLPLATSAAPISFNSQMDSPVINKWAIPSSILPAQSYTTPFSSIPITMTPEFSKISTQIPEYKPYFQIPSVPMNIPLSDWKCFTPNEYIPTLSTLKVAIPSFKPESQIIDKEKETLLFNEIMSLLEQPNSELSRDRHITANLPPNTATASSTSILNAIPMPIEFKIQSASPLTSMNQIKPLSMPYNQNLKMPSYFEPKRIVDIKHIMPNLQMKETDNNLIVDKETINEIESLLERDKQSRSIPQFDANVISEMKEPMYSVSQGNFEPYASENRAPISIASPVALANTQGANNLNPPYAMYNLAPIDFKPYTTDDKAQISMSSSVPYARPSIGVNNLKSPNPIYSLTPSKYEPYYVYDKTQTPISSLVSFARPNVNSFMAPFVTQKTSLTSAPHSNEYSPYTPVIETKLASITPSSESRPVPLSDISSVTNEYSSLPNNLEDLGTQSLILPNSQLTPLNLIKTENKPINEDTLSKTDNFNWSEIDLNGFEPYVEETETNMAKTDVDKAEDENDLKDFEPYEEDTETSIAKTDVYNADDNRLVYSNDLFDKNHEEPFISETQELNYIQEEKDLLPYASPNKDAFAKTVSPSLRANLPQNTFNSLPIETVTPRLNYATPISTLPSPFLKPLSLTPYKSTLDRINPSLPICENVLSPLLVPSPSSVCYTPSISMKPLQNTPISAYPTVPTSSFSLPNIPSLSTGSFQSSLLTPLSKSLSKSPVPLTNLLPNNLQYSASTKPCQPIPVSVSPTPSSAFKPYFPVNKVSFSSSSVTPNILEAKPFISSSQVKEQPCLPFESKPYFPVNKVLFPSSSVTPSSAPNILEVTPLVSLSQVKEQPCLPFESKPYLPVNKVLNPSPSVTPCTVLSVPCDNTLLSSPMVCSSPKLTPVPCTTPRTAVPALPTSQSLLPLPISSPIPISIPDYSTYTPSYPTKSLPISPFTSNVTPLENKPSVPSFKTSFVSQMPSIPVYSSISPTLSSPVMQILDLPSNPYLPFSKSTPICEDIPSLLPSISSTPYTKPAITNYIPNPYKISPDLIKNLEMLSPKEYQPFSTGYTDKNPVSGIKNPFISSSVSPIEISPLLPLSNGLNSFKPNLPTYTSTIQAPSLVSPHLSSYTSKLPSATVIPVQNPPNLILTKNDIAQNLLFLSNIPCLRPLLPNTESSISSPCINVMTSKPLSLGSENIQPIEVPSSLLTPPPLSSYNLIKAPSIKPCLSPCIPIDIPLNSLANTPINVPISTIVPNAYMPTFEPTVSPNSPCTSINIPAYLPTNTPINSPVSTIVPKAYMPILEPTVLPNHVPCSSVNVSPINVSPTSYLEPISIITSKAYTTPTFEPIISPNQYLPTSIPINLPAYSATKPLANTPIYNSPSSYSLPISTTAPKPYTPTFEPTVSSNRYPSPCIPINLPAYSPTNILANTPTIDIKPISPEPIPISITAPQLFTPRFEPTILPNHVPCTSINILPTNTLANRPINISPASKLGPISISAPKLYTPKFEPTFPLNQYLPPCSSLNIPAYSPSNPLANSPINISPTLPISTAAPKPSIPTFEPTVPPNQYVPTNIPVCIPSTPLTNTPINILPTSYPVPKPSTPSFVPNITPNLYYSPCSSINIPAYSPNNLLANRPTNISPGFNPVPMSTTAPKPCSPIFEPTIPPNYLPCTPFNIPAYSQTKTLVNRPINILPSSNLVPVSNTVPKSFEPTLPPKQYQPPCLPINLPAYTPTNPLANRPIINSPSSYPVPMSTTPYTPTFEPCIPPIQYQPPCIPINMPGHTPSLPVSPTTPKPTPTLVPIIQTFTPTQTSPSIISPLDTKSTHIHPHILQSPIISSTPNICSDSMKPSTVTIPLLSNLMSPLANKPLICSQSAQMPPCKTIPPSPLCIPSLKSPCLQETVTPFPTIFQPLSPVSSGSKSPILSPKTKVLSPCIPSLKSPCMPETVTPSSTIYQPLSSVTSGGKSPMSSPSYHQLLSPLLSSPKSPVTPICLPQSQFYIPPSDIPLNTAYNLPTPKPIQKPQFFLTPQNYRDLTQICTPYITSYSQPCLPPNKVINPTSPVDFLIPESRIQENKDFASLGDLNNLPNSLDGYVPYDVEEERDIKPEEKEFDNENLYTKEESLFDTSTEVFDDKTNKEHLEDNIHYINEYRPAYDTKYLIDNHYIHEPMNTQRNENKIDTIDFTNRKMEYNIIIPKVENNTEFRKEPLYNTDDLTPETTNKNPYLDNKNAYDYYKNQFNRPSTMNLEPNPNQNLDNLPLQPPNSFDYKEMPNIKYSGYKSYQTPLTNQNNIPPLICNPCIPTYRSMDSKLGLDFSPTNIYTPTENNIVQPEFNFNTINLGPKSLDLTRPETNFNNLNLSPKSLDLQQNVLNQPEICLNPVDLSPISNDLVTDTRVRQDNFNQPDICPNNVHLSPICNDLTTDTKAIKDSLIKYIKENDITKQNNEITIPIGNIVILDTKPNINNIEDFKDKGLDLKMWKSNVKIVNAEIKLKCKDITFNNFMPIMMTDSVNNYADVIKRYIEDKYGNCIVMDQPYSQENRHVVLNHFEPHAVGNEFNLLWPSQRW